MLDAFALDPSVTHLNHGSFGAVPRAVAEAQLGFRRQAEANPMRFFRVEAPALKVSAREVAGRLLGVGPDEVALVRNVTTGIATVLAALVQQQRLGADDVVVLHEQAYESVKRTVRHWCALTGATMRVVGIDIDATDDQVVSCYRRAFEEVATHGQQLRLVVVDAITSATGSVLPAAAVAAAARAAGGLVFVDAAHVPGHVEARPAASGAHFWSGTWHKWGFAPRGTTALWAAEEERDRLVPLTTSWNHGQPFPLPFDATGTDDFSGWFALEAAAEFWRAAGGLEIAERGRGLLADGAAVVDAALAATGLPRTDVRLPARSAPCLRLVALPDGVASDETAADRLYAALSSLRVEAQVTSYDGRGWVRLSGAVYNEPADYERLAEVLPRLMPGRPT